MAEQRDFFDGLLGGCKEPSMAAREHEKRKRGKEKGEPEDLFGKDGTGWGSEKRGSQKRKKGSGIGEEGQREEKGGRAEHRRASSGEIASNR
ncbi:hypothetical protein MRB53_010756 [Persea americana]|uniref:Uncharacterized protein n=1 Tax=Persea americana TaxID=3435 RepID=A0ACC2LSS6_PERAE|nr:hypothetical protein MRB53_010756 [Persea americana]